MRIFVLSISLSVRTHTSQRDEVGDAVLRKTVRCQTHRRNEEATDGAKTTNEAKYEEFEKKAHWK